MNAFRARGNEAGIGIAAPLRPRSRLLLLRLRPPRKLRLPVPRHPRVSQLTKSRLGTPRLSTPKPSALHRSPEGGALPSAPRTVLTIIATGGDAARAAAAIAAGDSRS